MTDVTPYLSGWVRTLPAKGDVAAYKRGDFTLHLTGSKQLRLTGRGLDERHIFYYAAVRVMETENEKWTKARTLWRILRRKL